ncbi:hypothetical protein [Kibdelosporangium phytohabitans]|uniref:Cobalamin-independent methionine synthase MetE N-terminal domain-containing protein n=1 Tax=Kibdelosporangium phytohabitans TaxID=860235 RepID=A0A0N9I456_9PSEU|nr:hypothetical protein [Kibdelosporangium phytohabitans]ALG09122.1 hypothetical protein AOZ06_21345 [Kibdelosporangium phytohabitans]MBE1469673.1 5-methyltetrahydropteroyltriglutamate--homocysteine methyltransferase [Kibdelosporangium phytohabitans]
MPSNTFTYGDQVLDTAQLFGAVPGRYRDLGLGSLDTYLAMSHGHGAVGPLEQATWFDTDSHYRVPEAGPATRFELADDTPVAEYLEAESPGVQTRPVPLGPVTFLLLGKGAAPLDPLLDCYAEPLGRFADAGANWVQLDEPAFCVDRTGEELSALRRAHDRLSRLSKRPKLLVAGYFGEFGPALPLLAGTAVDGIAVDLVAGPGAADQIPSVLGLRDKTLVAGVVDGRSIWRTDLSAVVSVCAAAGICR